MIKIQPLYSRRKSTFHLSSTNAMDATELSRNHMLVCNLTFLLSILKKKQMYIKVSIITFFYQNLYRNLLKVFR